MRLLPLVALLLVLALSRTAGAGPYPEGALMGTGLSLHAINATVGEEALAVKGAGWSLPTFGATVHSSAESGSPGGYGRFDFDGLFPLVLESIGLPARGGPEANGRRHFVQRAFLPPALELGPYWALADDFDWGLAVLMSPFGLSNDKADVFFFLDFGFTLQTRLELGEDTLLRPFFSYTWSWGEEKVGNESGLVGKAMYFGLEAIHRLGETLWAHGRFEWSQREASEARTPLSGGIGTLTLGVGWDLEF